MDTSLISYLIDTAAELTRKSETVFPSMAREMLLEAEELTGLAAKLLQRLATPHTDTIEFQNAA